MRKATNPHYPSSAGIESFCYDRHALQESRHPAATGTPHAFLIHQLEVKHAKGN